MEPSGRNRLQSVANRSARKPQEQAKNRCRAVATSCRDERGVKTELASVAVVPSLLERGSTPPGSANGEKRCAGSRNSLTRRGRGDRVSAQRQAQREHRRREADGRIKTEQRDVDLERHRRQQRAGQAAIQKRQ